MHSEKKITTRAPLAPVAIAFIAGIVLQEMFRYPWNPVLLMAAGASVSWMIISWRTLEPPWPVMPMVLTAAAILTAARWMALQGDSPDDLGRIAVRLPQHATVRGVVWTDPTVRERDAPVARGGRDAGEGASFERLDFEMIVSAAKFGTAWETASGRVMVRWTRRVDGEADGAQPQGIEFGREIEVDGVLEEPMATRNFGLFDYRSYLARRGIRQVIRADGAGLVTEMGWAMGGQWVYRARKKLADRLTLGIEDDTLAVGIIRGMLLGYREDIPRDVNESFRRTGTLHVFAISGSHISLIGLALLVVLRQMRVPRRWASLVVMPALIFYVAATGLCASAVRSLVMAGLVIAGWTLHRPAALLNNLAAAALIILAWDPLQLFDPGFQLSFVVVTALILLTPILDARILSWMEPDPYIPRALVPGWRLTIQPACRWISQLVAVCLAAWVGSFGLNVYYFNLVSFVSILANLAIVPLASASVAIGVTSLLLGLVWDQVAITFNAAHALLIDAMVAVSGSLSGWRFGFFYVAQPSPLWVVAGYAMGVVMFLLAVRGRKRWAALLGVAVAVSGVAGVAWAWSSSRVRVDVLDVGAGQAVLVTGPHWERVLLDAGGQRQAGLVVEPFLRSRGVNAIDVAVISHGDTAHFGGLAELMRRVRVKRVVVADRVFRSKGYRAVLEELGRSGVPLERWGAGASRMLHGGELAAHWPTADAAFTRADDLGLVLEWSTPGVSLLFAGDLGLAAEEEVLCRVPGRPRVLVQGLATEGGSFGESWLGTLKPEILVMNTGEYPFKALPSPAVLERLERSRVRVLRTDQVGGVILEIEGAEVRCRSYLGGGE